MEEVTEQQWRKNYLASSNGRSIWPNQILWNKHWPSVMEKVLDHLQWKKQLTSCNGSSYCLPGTCGGIQIWPGEVEQVLLQPWLKSTSPPDTIEIRTDKFVRLDDNITNLFLCFPCVMRQSCMIWLNSSSRDFKSSHSFGGFFSFV